MKNKAITPLLIILLSMLTYAQNTYTKVKDSLGLNNAMQYAIESLKKLLKTDKFLDGNKYAQTRIAASYGLLQMLYTTARYNFGYQKNLLPEELIEPNNIQYSKKKVLYHLNKLKNKENGNENNWNLGLEGSIRDYLWYPWNPKYKKYPDKVHENVLLYKEIK